MSTIGFEADRQKFYVFNSKITAVFRDGPDLIVTVRDIWDALRRPEIRAACRFDGTLCFAGLLRIRSRDLRNEAVERRLEPGWEVSSLTFDGLTARMVVEFHDMHDGYPTLHEIYCDSVTLSRRLNVDDSLAAYFFTKSYVAKSGVSRQPPPSPPVPGQENLEGIVLD